MSIYKKLPYIKKIITKTLVTACSHCSEMSKL